MNHSTTNDKLKNLRIEYHILQSFPVTCLNRDDLGMPKSAIVGGVERARVSSQCWKRYVRLALRDLGVRTGYRTKKLYQLVGQACIELGASDDQARACSDKIAKELSEDTLIFLSTSEATALAQYAKEQNFDSDAISNKALAKVTKKVLNRAQDALDIALFGRMVAKAAEMNVPAAASFSHAISTHQVASELEFFTAVDDFPDENGTGSAHMGSLEFNSATYYRYISLDIGQLAQTLGLQDDPEDQKQLQQAIANFSKALFIAVPGARQTTQSGASPWDFARVLVRRGQRLQASFETPIAAGKKGGYCDNSIAALNQWISDMETQCGSLYGKIGDFRWGIKNTEDTNASGSIDQLIDYLQQKVA